MTKRSLHTFETYHQTYKGRPTLTFLRRWTRMRNREAKVQNLLDQFNEAARRFEERKKAETEKKD